MASLTSRIRAAIAVSITLVLISSSSTAAIADASVPETDPVGFAAFDTSSFSDVYRSMMENNDPAKVAALLQRFAESKSADREALKLGSLSDAEATDVLDEASVYAKAGEPLPPQLSARVGSGPNAPIQGEAINAGFSWEMNGRAGWSECEWFMCEVKSWIDFRVVTDPNDVNTASYWTATEGGEGRLHGFEMDSMVYQDGNFTAGTYGKSWSTPGYGTQWTFHPLDSNDGHTFQAEYNLNVSTPSGGMIYTSWSTGVSHTCGEPTPGAFRCLFD